MADPENQPEQPKAVPEKQVIGKISSSLIVFNGVFLYPGDQRSIVRAGVVSVLE